MDEELCRHIIPNTVNMFLRKGVLPVSLGRLSLLEIAELEVMRRPVVLVVVVARRAELHAILHTCSMLYSHEVVIPWAIIRNLRQ